MISAEVEASLHGLEFEEAAKRFDSKLLGLLIERLAEVAYFEAFYGVPWKRGNLARSIVKEVEADSAVIRVLARYGVFVVSGTAPHVIRPAGASCSEPGKPKTIIPTKTVYTQNSKTRATRSSADTLKTLRKKNRHTTKSKVILSTTTNPSASPTKMQQTTP